MARATSTTSRVASARAPKSRQVATRGPEQRKAGQLKPAPKKVTKRRPSSKIAKAVNGRSASTASRRAILTVLTVVIGLVVIMLAVVSFQTRLAERQLRIDRIEAQIQSERDRYNALRVERSALREPGRLEANALALGMEPGSGADFTSVDPITVAQVLVSTGGLDPELLETSADPFSAYGEFKSIVGGKP
ncbi:MAG: hypothetical protein RL391_1857 [Actinomycetota bacterium]|jgi:cell division protein FtsL